MYKAMLSVAAQHGAVLADFVFRNAVAVEGASRHFRHRCRVRILAIVEYAIAIEIRCTKDVGEVIGIAKCASATIGKVALAVVVVNMQKKIRLDVNHIVVTVTLDVGNQRRVPAREITQTTQFGILRGEVSIAIVDQQTVGGELDLNHEKIRRAIAGHITGLDHQNIAGAAYVSATIKTQPVAVSIDAEVAIQPQCSAQSSKHNIGQAIAVGVEGFRVVGIRCLSSRGQPLAGSIHQHAGFVEQQYRVGIATTDDQIFCTVAVEVAKLNRFSSGIIAKAAQVLCGSVGQIGGHVLSHCTWRCKVENQGQRNY